MCMWVGNGFFQNHVVCIKAGVHACGVCQLLLIEPLTARDRGVNAGVNGQPDLLQPLVILLESACDVRGREVNTVEQGGQDVPFFVLVVEAGVLAKECNHLLPLLPFIGGELPMFKAFHQQRQSDELQVDLLMR